MLWFTYYKGTFSTFVFATQNRAFMLRGPPGGSRKPSHTEAKRHKKAICGLWLNNDFRRYNVLAFCTALHAMRYIAVKLLKNNALLRI
jgi:hypothetical protein